MEANWDESAEDQDDLQQWQVSNGVDVRIVFLKYFVVGRLTHDKHYYCYRLLYDTFSFARALS